MKDMDKATDRIQTAFNNKEKILVFGDYDVDGTTSVASMYSFLANYATMKLIIIYRIDTKKDMV
jgi:single-stranded-DNA-specific exonuclease